MALHTVDTKSHVIFLSKTGLKAVWTAGWIFLSNVWLVVLLYDLKVLFQCSWFCENEEMRFEGFAGWMLACTWIDPSWSSLSTSSWTAPTCHYQKRQGGSTKSAECSCPSWPCILLLWLVCAWRDQRGLKEGYQVSSCLTSSRPVPGRWLEKSQP